MAGMGGLIWLSRTDSASARCRFRHRGTNSAGELLRHDRTMSFPSGRGNPHVTKYKYLGCVIDEFLDLNAMVDDRVEAGRRALGSLLREAQSAVGVLFGAICPPLRSQSLRLS